jgi:hypothetical protein
MRFTGDVPNFGLENAIYAFCYDLFKQNMTIRSILSFILVRISIVQIKSN